MERGSSELTERDNAGGRSAGVVIEGGWSEVEEVAAATACG
jgi:hypothetical protein